MKLVADECCDALLVEGLRMDGHDVVYVKESFRGAKDDVVLRVAASEERVLLTEDKDFGELVVRLGLPAFGIIFLRMNPADSTGKLRRLRAVLKKHEQHLPGFFVVVDQRKVRFRPLFPSQP